MMFDLHSITLINFRSYKGTHVFEFPLPYGLYFFTGKNVAEPALGANGSGKSTLLDAITWVLFGRTTRGLKANEVLSWDSTASCQVILDLTVGDQRFKIKRTQKPNQLLLDDKPVDLEELKKHIRLNYESFLYSVINTQFGESFLALSPSFKLSIFSDILNLDFWILKSEDAADKTLKLKNHIRILYDTIINLQGQIEIIKKDTTLFSEDLKNFEQTKKDEIKFKKHELRRISDQAVDLNDKILEINNENIFYLKRQEELLDCLIDTVQQNARDLSTCQGEINALKEQQLEITKLGKVCPVCHQNVDKDHVFDEEFALTKTIARRISALKAIKMDLDCSKKELIKAKSVIASIKSRIDETKEKEQESRTIQSKIDRLKSEILELKRSTNPWISLVTLKKEQFQKTTAMIKSCIQQKQKLDAEYESVNFWVKGFKRIRLFIIEQAFQTLELEVNNCLAQLGMPDWEITFDIERENKVGGITKGFVTFIKSPSNNEPVRWENWSGGETQRLQLAGDLGLANLIMQQNGLSNTIEFYDEPSTHLSPEGMNDLANMLHERAINEGKRIWLVDHSSITNFGEFEGIIIARKDENGSKLSYSST